MLVGQLGREPLELLGLTQQGARAREELAAGGGRRDALGVMADEQLHVEHRLELRERRGNGRLGDGMLSAALVTLPASQVATKYSSWRIVKRMRAHHRRGHSPGTP